MLRHFVLHALPPDVGYKPRFSWKYYAETSPELEEDHGGIYMPRAMDELTIGTVFGLLTLYEQRVVSGVPVLHRKALYPATPVWWDFIEMLRGTAAGVSQIVALQGRQRIRKPLGRPYHPMLASL